MLAALSSSVTAQANVVASIVAAGTVVVQFVLDVRFAATVA
jgi:hypothetical protein